MSGFEHMCAGVRQFLDGLDMKARLGCVPSLYLEFPDIQSMRAAHIAIMDCLNDYQKTIGRGLRSEYLDDETLKFEPYAGVQIVLTCKQRFAQPNWKKTGYKSAGYRDIRIIDKGEAK